MINILDWDWVIQCYNTIQAARRLFFRQDSEVLAKEASDVYVVVDKVKGSSPTRYTVDAVLRDGVAIVPPYMPANQTFTKSNEFEEFLIAKSTQSSSKIKM